MGPRLAQVWLERDLAKKRGLARPLIRFLVVREPHRPLLIFALAIVTCAVAPAAAQAPTCEACSPETLVEQSERALIEATRFQLQAGRLPRDRPAVFLVAARSYAEIGQPDQALPLAQRAASECILTGDEGGCAETIAFLAELTLNKAAGDEDLEDEALAYLSLLPYEKLSGTQCAEAVSLRYRLSERRSPRAASASWADRCGALGRIGEPGYRAAKAAVLTGEFEGAEKRLEHLRAFSSEYAIRSTYLFAVIHVARGHVNAAQKAFSAIVALPASGLRSEEEDDARVLAALQLGRIERERGEYEAALAAYRQVPSLSQPRADALLEGAVVAAHIGEMGTAQNYLQALPRYNPQVNRQLDMNRLLANLAILNGQDEDALATFKTLTALGDKARAETFGPGAPDPKARLNEDPTLNGLLDPRDAERLVALEEEMARLQAFLDEQRGQLAQVQQVLDDGGPSGPLKRALDKLEGADVLLRRAENLLAQREAAGIKVAGPAESALGGFRHARSLRVRLDRALIEVRQQFKEQRAMLFARLAEVEAEVGGTERTMAALEGEAAEVFTRRRELLVQRAENVVHRLEMAEDVGMMELSWQRKRRATVALEKVNEEYNRNTASLKVDAAAAAD
jgi:tetratricopeptide (TPR) repeat protein